jgi:hypothetical protein
LICALIAGAATLIALSTATAQPGPGRVGPAAGERPPAPDPPADLTPEEVAANCIERVTALAARCAQHNTDLGAMCVAKINELIADGQDDEALALAERCVGYIREASGHCAHRIRHDCRRCLHLLERLEADDELIVDVEDACRTALDLVRTSAQTAIQEISDAVGVEFPEEDPEAPVE